MHAKIFEEAGLPRGLLSVLVGESSEIGDAVVTHPSSHLVSFTGSTGVGRSLYGKIGASPNIKRLALELAATRRL
jgi:acyl-CoA reductase-like NAD-dependent aldehyde dehydrogenase